MFKPIAKVAETIATSRDLTEADSPGSLPVCAADSAPERDRLCDIEIPRRVWSTIKIDDRPREIVRALTARERAALIKRQGELTAATVPVTKTQVDRVVLAISDMFGGFRSATRNIDPETAVAMADAARRMLAPLPAWAIERGCRDIQRGQAGLNHKYLPNDNEIYDVVERIVQPYRDRLQECKALLAAPVERPAPLKLAAPPPDDAPQGASSDGRHAARVEADLEERRARRAEPIADTG